MSPILTPVISCFLILQHVPLVSENSLSSLGLKVKSPGDPFLRGRKTSLICGEVSLCHCSGDRKCAGFCFMDSQLFDFFVCPASAPGTCWIYKGEIYWHTYTYPIYYLPQFYTDPLKRNNLASKCCYFVPWLVHVIKLVLGWPILYLPRVDAAASGHLF